MPSRKQTVFSPDSIHSSPETPQRRNIPMKDVIMATPPRSQTFSHSQRPLSPHAPNSLNNDGFPVLDPSTSQTWM